MNRKTAIKTLLATVAITVCRNRVRADLERGSIICTPERFSELSPETQKAYAAIGATNTLGDVELTVKNWEPPEDFVVSFTFKRLVVEVAGKRHTITAEDLSAALEQR